MQDLIKQEEFELEVLDRLNTKRLLNNLIFCGGTMLRLCFGLNRFSVDLDFWLIKGMDYKRLFKDFKTYLEQFYTIRDCINKFHTLLFEIKSKDFPHSLKIEIRKESKKIKTEEAIAYSRYSNLQVILKVVSPEEMMQQKLQAFLARKEIRDAFDLEFLLKKGIPLDASGKVLSRLNRGLGALTRKDYTVKLCSLLDDAQRRYYLKENFKLLKLVIKEKITHP